MISADYTPSIEPTPSAHFYFYAVQVIDIQVDAVSLIKVMFCCVIDVIE